MNELKIEKVKTKQNNFTLCVNGYFLHSKYNPISEAERFVEKHFIPNKTIILFGNGIGYIAEILKKKITENNRLIIIEPLENSNEIQVENNVITLETRDIHFIKEYFTKELDMYEEVCCVCSPNYDKVFPQLYLEILRLIKNSIHSQKIMKNTINQFAELWQKNYIENLKNVCQDSSLIHLKSKYNVPVVVTSGGPSLSKQLEKLKEIQEDVVIIAAGSAVNSLLQQQIEPDYVMSIDGGEPNYWHFQNLYLTKTKIIYSLFNHPKIRPSFTEKGYYFLSADGDSLQKHFKRVVGVAPTIVPGGGSVANYALPIAMFITDGPITFIGQDLAYTNNQSHAANNRFYRPIDDEFKKKRDAFLTKGYYGDEVLTDPVFFMMKEHFEEFLKNNTEERMIFNSTEGGLNIEGMENLPFEEFCTRYVKHSDTKNADENLEQDNFHSVYQMIELLQDDVEIYIKIKRDSMNILNLLHKSENKGYFSEETLNKIDFYDKKIQSNLEIVPMQIILKPISIDIQKNFQPTQNESANESYVRILLQNKELYSRLIKATEKMKDYTFALIEGLQKRSQTL